MASYHAISAIGQALVALLKAARPAGEFPNAEIKLAQAKDFQKGLDEGVSVYLYRVTVSTARRSLPPKQGPTGRLLRPQLPLDLFYMVTPWGKTAEMQHLLLGWAMRTIEDTARLDAGVLNAHSPGTFDDHEAVELISDTLSIQDYTSLWEMGKPNIQVSALYVARVVAIDSRVEHGSDAGVVQARGFDGGPLERDR